MDFSGKIVLSFIEEDNVQRAYFRIRPLLTGEGALTKQDIDALPDDGYLRIVPDKNEQHTFKDRMRSLGYLCVLDLKNIHPKRLKSAIIKTTPPPAAKTTSLSFIPTRYRLCRRNWYMK